MTGVQVFTHSLRMVLDNGGAALRLSGLIMGVQLVLVLALGQQASFLPIDPATGAPVGGRAEAPDVGGQGFLVLVQLALGLWVSVAWHRFILMDQAPAGFIPLVPGRAFLRYLGVALLYGLMLLLAAIPLSVLGFFLIGPAAIAGQGGVGPWALILYSLLVGVPVGYLALRLAPILAAAALRKPLPLSEVWYRSGTHGGTLLMLTFVVFLAFTVVNMPVAVLAASFPGLAFGYAFVVQWAVVLVTASLVNTLYLSIIEDEPIHD